MIEESVLFKPDYRLERTDCNKIIEHIIQCFKPGTPIEVCEYIMKEAKTELRSRAVLQGAEQELESAKESQSIDEVDEILTYRALPYIEERLRQKILGKNLFEKIALLVLSVATLILSIATILLK